MEYALYSAAVLIVFIGFLHSYLGEKYILMRLFQRPNIPKLFGGTEFTIRTLRFAWHLTTVAWLGFAVILVQMTNSSVQTKTLAIVIGIVFTVHFVIALVASKAKHLSWPVFLVISLLIFYVGNSFSGT